MTSSNIPRRAGPGCFGYGCLIATVIFCVVIGSVWFFGLRSMRSAVDQYIAREFTPLAPIAVRSEAASSALRKIGELQAAGREDRALEVEFSDQEVQALIDATPWKNWLRVGFSGDEVSLTFALPLAALGEWKAASLLVGDISERALVGNARCRFHLSDKKPKLSFSELVLNGHSLEDLPRGHAGEWITGAIAQAAQDTESEVASVETLRKLREVKIKDGKLAVVVGVSDGS